MVNPESQNDRLGRMVLVPPLPRHPKRDIVRAFLEKRLIRAQTIVCRARAHPLPELRDEGSDRISEFRQPFRN